MLDITRIRSQFPALSRTDHSRPVAYFDGPAGSQVPASVAQAVSTYLTSSNANRGAPFATSQETDRTFHEAHQAIADFLGTNDPSTTVFGQNMTSLTLALSRGLGRTWKPGDEIIVSRLDHDANVTPWVLAARDAGATVRHIEINLEDCTLNLESFRSLLNEKTRLVAVGYASNAVGTVNPVNEIVDAAHDVGALTFIDAVHYAPHGLIDVQQLDCDFLACSAYKFFGPHVGILYGKRELLESIQPYKLRPSPNTVPDRWMTGTQNHEGLAGVVEAVNYLAGVSGDDPAQPRRERLRLSFQQIEDYERGLAGSLLDGLKSLRGFRIWGITNPDRLGERVPTISVTHSALKPREIAETLAAQGLWTWPGNHYALPFTESAGLEPGGTLRIGLLHYNTQEEVQRLLAAMGDF